MTDKSKQNKIRGLKLELTYVYNTGFGRGHINRDPFAEFGVKTTGDEPVLFRQGCGGGVFFVVALFDPIQILVLADTAKQGV